MAVEVNEIDQSVHTQERKDPDSARVGLPKVDPKKKAAWHEKMKEEGIVLPGDHAFTQILESTGKRLNILPEIDFCAVDTDQEFAFFKPNLYEIWHSSGLYHRAIKQQLPLAEDHIAAVNAHEGAHGDKLDDKEISDPDYDDYTSCALSFFRYPEEVRADAQAMRKLSRAGYNPTALIEVFKTLPPTTGRFDPSHPELIDRIRLMEERLSDDENPLSHTSKPMAPLDPALYRWLAEEREFHQLAQTMLSKNPQELTESVLQTGTQHDFWITLWIKQHSLKVAAAKDFVAKNPKLMDKLLFKLILYYAGSQRKFFQEGKIDETDLAGTYSDGTKYEFDCWDYVGTSVGWRRDAGKSSGGFNTPKAIIDSDVFRQKLEPFTAENISTSKLTERLQYLEGDLDIVFGGMESVWGESTKDPELVKKHPKAKRLATMVLECYKSGSLSKDIVLTAFKDFDAGYQQGQRRKEAAKMAEKGLRSKETKMEGSFDLHDLVQRAKFFDKVKLDIAIRLMPDVSISSQEKEHLIALISEETKAPLPFAKYIAETSLIGESGIDLPAFLATLDRTDYPKLLDSILALEDEEQTLNYGTEKKIFSQRPLHAAYQASLESEDRLYSKPLLRPKLMEFGEMKDLLSDHFEKLYQSGEGFTLEEFNALVKLRKIRYESKRDEWVVKAYIHALQEGREPDGNIAHQIKKIRNWATYNDGEKCKITPAELLLLIKNSPWDTPALCGILGIIHAGRLIDDVWEDLEEKTDKQRFLMLESLQLVYNLSLDPRLEKEPGFDNHTILSLMLEIQQGLYISQGQPELDALLSAFKTIADKDYPINCSDLKRGIKDFHKLKKDEVQKLINFITDYEKNTGRVIDYPGKFERFTLVDRLYLLNEIPEKIRGKETFEQLMACLIKNHQRDVVLWLTSHLKLSTERDKHLIALLEYTNNYQVTNKTLLEMGLDPIEEETYKQLNRLFSAEIFQHLTFGPDADIYNSKRSPNFPYYLYEKRQKFIAEGKEGYVTYSFDETIFMGEGKLAEVYPDLLLRRHPFSTLAATNHDFPLRKDWFGSFYQKVYAKRLVAAEPVLFDYHRPLEERVKYLESLVPFSSVVRDIHIELLLKEELSQAENHQQRVAAGKLLLPLFTKNSSLRISLATAVFRSELAMNPSLVKDFNAFIPILQSYLPKASFARNYFLNLLEEEVALTVDQLREIVKLRLSPGDKKEVDDNGSQVFVFSKILSEANRTEKIKFMNWILGISSEKPIPIIEAEKRSNGHLDNLPRTIFMMTDDEKAVFFKRLFLGSEGILDLETVKYEIKEGDEGYNQETAQTSWDAYIAKKEFLQGLAVHLFPYDMAYNAFFRNALVTILEKSEPTRASQTLTKLITRLTDVQAKGEKVAPEEIIAIGLSELGVVGKKVAQALSEISQIPESYRDLFKKAQEEGPVVPKRALLMLAEDAGLLDDDSPIQIVSFDKLLNAASNKQAALLTIDVRDASVGLPIGRHQLVGKFKRPSAQKIRNLEHDLKVINKVVELAKECGLADDLPDDFIKQIQAAILRELDFQQERIFSRELREDIANRNKKRQQKVEIPTIYFSGDDVMLEQQAKGISLRRFLDLQRSDPLTLLREGYGNLREKTIVQGLTSELLAQIIKTGRLHEDAHPGNIFVDKNSVITLIDLGMHKRLTSKERQNTISLLAGLTMGDEIYTKKILKEMGWNLDEMNLGFKRLNFSANSKALFGISKKYPPASEVLSSIILSTSKLSIYTQSLSTSELLRSFVSAVNIREVPATILRLLQRR